MDILQRDQPRKDQPGGMGMLYKAVALCLFPFFLSGCAGPALQVQSSVEEQRPIPSTTVYFYPNNGQTEEKQERDRYECYLWAVDQTGFDPGQQDLTPHQRILVKPSTPAGTDVAFGAASGAVLGSILAHPHARGEGLVFGLIAGSVLGIAAELSKQDQADKLQQQYDNAEQQHYAQLERQASGYRKAISACLEGRDYTVQ